MAERTWRKRYGCVGCLTALSMVLIGLIVAATLVGDRRRPGPPPARPSAAPAPVAPVAIGAEGVLRRPGETGVWMAVSIKDYHALVAAEREMEREEPGRRAIGRLTRGALAAKARIQLVRDGTRVRVMASGAGGLRVEAVDGEAAGRSGWVHPWCVHAAESGAPKGRG